jgi:hypothetical protein
MSGTAVIFKEKTVILINTIKSKGASVARATLVVRRSIYNGRFDFDEAARTDVWIIIVALLTPASSILRTSLF